MSPRVEGVQTSGMLCALTSTGHAEVVAALRNRRLRVTAPRLAVLAVLTDGKHMTSEEVALAAREGVGAISTQAVYDILGVLTRGGLVRRIEPAGSPARYETRVGDNHHHAVCRACGAITDVDCVVGDPPCVVPADGSGFVIDEAEVTFWGLCPDCQTTPPTTRTRRGG